MKLTYFRILIYPFITFMCLLPIIFYSSIYVDVARENAVFKFVGYALLNSIGLFYSFALGLTPEFREALKYHKKPTKLNSSLKE